MILKKLSARTCYRLGKSDAMHGRDPLSPGYYTGAYYDGYTNGLNAWHDVMMREHHWAMAALVAENARLKRKILAYEDAARGAKKIARDMRLRALGFEEVTEEQRERNLASNLALLDWSKG